MTGLAISTEEARTWYREEDPVHGFDHVMRVYRLAETIARQEGADQKIVTAAALLHDADYYSGENPGGDSMGMHHQRSAAFAKQVLKIKSWDASQIEAVQHCIRAHRFRDNSEEPQTIEARVLFDADKLDAIGAIGIARAVAYAARVGQPIHHPVSDSFMKEGILEEGEPHSAYHEYLFKLCRIKDRMTTRTGRQLAEDRHAFMSAYFEHLENEIGGES